MKGLENLNWKASKKNGFWKSIMATLWIERI